MFLLILATVAERTMLFLKSKDSNHTFRRMVNTKAVQKVSPIKKKTIIGNAVKVNELNSEKHLKIKALKRTNTRPKEQTVVTAQ